MAVYDEALFLSGDWLLEPGLPLNELEPLCEEQLKFYPPSPDKSTGQVDSLLQNPVDNLLGGLPYPEESWLDQGIDFNLLDSLISDDVPMAPLLGIDDALSTDDQSIILLNTLSIPEGDKSLQEAAEDLIKCLQETEMETEPVISLDSGISSLCSSSDSSDSCVSSPSSSYDLESFLSSEPPSPLDVDPLNDSDPEYKPSELPAEKSSKSARRKRPRVAPYPTYVSEEQEEEVELKLVEVPAHLPKKERKKLQNKNAATRYRMKKKAEATCVTGSIDDISSRNKELKSKVDELSREINYLKELMKDVLKAKSKQ